MSITDMAEIIKIDIDQTVEIEEFHLVIEYNVDKTIKIGQGMIRTIGMTLGKEISDQIRFIEDRIIKVNIEEIMVMKIMNMVGVGLEKDSIKIIPEGMTKVVVDLDQDLELVLIETGSDVTNVENTIILLRTV